MATEKRAGARATLIKGPQWGENGHNNEAGPKRIKGPQVRRRTKMATVKRADAVAIQIKDPPSEETATLKRANGGAILIEELWRVEKGGRASGGGDGRQ